MLDGDLAEQTPPFWIRLNPWGADAAEELHRRFGSDVELRVGFQRYPAERQRPRTPPSSDPAGLLDPGLVAVELDAPAVVRSGRTLHHQLTVHNLSDSELEIATNGAVTATVVASRTGERIGGFSGTQVGTASSKPELGYAVPPGEWGIQATLELGEDRRRTPILPLTIIP
jgi:hypothetical protein